MPLPELQEDLPTLEDAGRLRQQSRTLVARADMLSEQRMELLRESRALEREAEAIEKAIADVEANARRRGRRREARGVARDAERLGRVCDVLKGVGPLAISEIAEDLGIGIESVRPLVQRLEQIGLVTRTGVKRGTRYHLTDDNDVPDENSNVREFGNYATVVRDAIIKLDTFEFVDLQRECPLISEGTLRRWLTYFEERGIVASERDGKRKVYAYEQPKAQKVERRRAPTPEQTVAADAAIRVPERGQAVAGVGAVREGKLVGELLREIRKVAPDVTWTRTAHTYTFRLGGRAISDCSSTPGKATHLGDTRKRLRAAGVMVKP